jgi:predicted SAM-dependent methyltransferase
MKELLSKLGAPMVRTARLVQMEMKIGRAAKLRPLRVIIGAQGVDQQGWVSTEIEQLNPLKFTNFSRYFEEGSIDAIMAEHIWEHMTAEEADRATRNCFQFLRPGGYMRIAVPDGLHPSPVYRESVRPGSRHPDAQDHHFLYDYVTLQQVFEFVGFDVQLLEYFDEAGKFHHRKWNAEDGLIKRSFKYDERNRDGKPNYTSLIMDARKEDTGMVDYR